MPSSAVAYDILGNLPWFLSMVFSVVLLAGVLVGLLLCYLQGFRFSADQPDDKLAEKKYESPYPSNYDSELFINN